MNLLPHLKQYLIEERIVSPNDRLSFTLSIGDINRKKSRIIRRYIVTKQTRPMLVARVIPNDWMFPLDDIEKTYSKYSSLGSVKVPKLLGRFSTPDGTFFIEEFVGTVSSLESLIRSKEIEVKQGIAILKKVFSEIWSLARVPSKEFIAEEKKRFRRYLSAFVPLGAEGETVLEKFDNIIDTYSGSLKRVWSTGDIIDRNILRSGSDWYLIDYEYSHDTLFFFKDVFRNIHFSPWTQGFSVREIFPGIGEFPEEMAKLISLAWDHHLQDKTIERRAHRPTFESMRETFWHVLGGATWHSGKPDRSQHPRQ